MPPEDGSCDETVETSNADSESASDSDSDLVAVSNSVVPGVELEPKSSKNIPFGEANQPSSTQNGLRTFQPADGIKHDMEPTFTSPVQLTSVLKAIDSGKNKMRAGIGGSIRC